MICLLQVQRYEPEISCMDSIKIWFNPPQFWTVTRNMKSEAADELMQLVYDLAQARNIEALKKFSFITVEDLSVRRKAVGE
jgi:hypothetical protein